MRFSMDDVAGLTLVVAGGDLAAVGPVRDRLAALGANVSALVGDVESLARAIAAEPPDAVVSTDPGLRERLDPFGLRTGPPVVGADEDVGAAVELRRLRSRETELVAVIAEQARGAERAEGDLLDRLLLAASYRDDNTLEHTRRVAALAARIAHGLGLPPREIALIVRAAPLHDIGKIAIPDSILLKPGRLTAEEFEVVKTHALVGARVLAGGGSDLLRAAKEIAQHHHERWDGGGYPAGLAGDEIPVAARVVHLADVFDVLVHERPYRESLSAEAAAREIAAGAGNDFDPAAVEVFAQFSLQI